VVEAVGPVSFTETRPYDVVELEAVIVD